jgi:hypothetical protein
VARQRIPTARKVSGGPLRVLGWLAVVAMLGLAVAGPAVLGVAANDTPGNNGTVKIHEGATETEPGPQNEPHVCTFHLHFFFADPEQAGTWEIQEWAPGDKGTVVLWGTYDTMGDGEDREPDAGTYTLPDGHYKLFWDGDLDTAKHDKHKVFWVDCPEATPTGSEQPTDSAPGSGSVPPSESLPPSGSIPPTGSELPTGSASVPPTGSASIPPTGSELPIESGLPSGSAPVAPSFSGGVGGVSGAPAATLPPTDVTTDRQPTGDTWRVLLAGLAALVAMILMLTPARAEVRIR